jgi:hypothetical protein
MSSNIADFDRRLRARARAFPLRVAERHAEVAEVALTAVVEESPVREGGFRGAWTVSVGQPNPIDPETPDKDGAATIERGVAVLEGLRPFELVYLNNARPYARRIDRGWSEQAPAGVTEVALQRVRAWLGRHA